VRAGRDRAIQFTLPGFPLDRNDRSSLGSTSPAPDPPLEVVVTLSESSIRTAYRGSMAASLFPGCSRQACSWEDDRLTAATAAFDAASRWPGEGQLVLYGRIM
jgi:hypothetical protein